MIDFGRIARRPEFSAFIGMVFVYLFFAFFGWPNFSSLEGSSTWINVAAELGLIALPVALVMIAGHLDLSVGSTLAAGAMTYAILGGYLGMNQWMAAFAGMAMGVIIGFGNGFIVTRTKLPSFIVTLATMFALRGLVFGVTRLTTSTVLVPVAVDPGVKTVFGTRIAGGFETALIFFFVLAAIISWILYRTKYGNWIFAIGGDETSARAAGVPVERTVIALYMGSGFGSALLGVIQVALYSSAQVSAGQSYVFFSIIAVVVGGVLLTGGYGSPVGVIFGTFTFAIVSQGIYSTGWDSDWSSLILGILLLAAVLSNNTFRRLALSGVNTSNVENTGSKEEPELPEPALEPSIEEDTHA